MALFKPRDEEEVFTEDDWKEAIATYQPGGGETFSNDNGECTVQCYVDAEKIRSAKSFVLGYSYADDATPWALHRIPPADHPFYGPQFRATSVSFQRFSPIGNSANTNREPYELSPFGSDGITKFGKYEKAMMTVRFAGPMPYYLYSDDNEEWSGFEYDRYCTRYDVESNLEVLMADTNRFMTYVEGPLVNETVPSTVGLYLTKTTFVMTWHEVPESFIFNSLGVPQKVIDCVGKVNSADFMGFPAGTLLLQSPKFQRKCFPFFSDDGRAFHYTITLPFLHFDPELGDTATRARGHNLFPYSIDGKWYLATRDGTVLGPRYIFEQDFATMFTHVSS